MLKRKDEPRGRRGLPSIQSTPANGGMDRRAFLRRSGLVAGSLTTLGAIGLDSMRKAEAGPPPPAGAAVTMRKSICTHCSVGCTVLAQVANDVWIGQEPAWDSPISRGSFCAKGAALRELASGDRRLRYPMKMMGGQWTRISWDQAVTEIGDKLLEIRQNSGPDSVYLLGSAKMTNEGAYLFRKFAALWGSNNVDHQARICHSTTVAGVANTWGYGAMTNSYNDIRNAKTILIWGGNPAEAHPVSMQHIIEGAELNHANFIVVDPRLTRTAAHATEYVRLRPGTDIPVFYGMMWHILKKGWEDKQFIAQRVYGFEAARKEIEKWTPEEVERVSGVPGEQLERVARMFATQKPATLIWCMGVTQHSVGTANVRAASIALLLTGNVGGAGMGANIFRGHDNVQGATDCGLDITTLPFYYGLSETAWRHWGRVWQIDYDWLQSRFESKQTMEKPGIPVSRWFDGVLLPKEQVDQKDNVRAMWATGFGINAIGRIPDALKAVAKLDLLVVVDPHPTAWASLSVEAGRKDGTYLLPACTQFESAGSRVASNCSVQWGEQIVPPLFECKDDYEIIYLMAKKLGFADLLFKNIAVEKGRPVPEDILREINRGAWSTGYTGVSPERIKLHMANQKDFDLVTLRAADGPCKGDYYGLPWPCWGKPDLKHPGSPNLYDTSLHVMDGGSTFRARFGVEREGVNLLAEGSYSKGSEIQDGYPEFTYAVLKKLGWDGDLTAEELAVIQSIGGANPDTVSWSTDLSGGIQRVAIKHGCVPHGNAKARMNAFGLLDPVPVHREPIYSPRPDLVGQYPTYPDAKQFRLPNVNFSVQKAAVEKGTAGAFPLIFTTGRIVEYEGSGEETRSNKWLAELQQNMFAEINPADAKDRGIKDGAFVWVTGINARAKVKALVTERVAKGVVWMPYHFAGWSDGRDLRANYPPGLDPIVLGESANVITGYGYDPVTGMQEPKSTLCQVRAA